VTVKLWVSTALSPQRNQWGLVVAAAETRKEAIDKVRTQIERERPTALPSQQEYAQSLLDNLESTIRQWDGDVKIDWSAADKPH